LIKEWNFVDEQGNKMPIDGEHLQLLNTDDVEYLVTEIQKFVEEVKKVVENLAMLCVEMGWTERQLMYDNTFDFVSKIADSINKNYGD